MTTSTEAQQPPALDPEPASRPRPERRTVWSPPEPASDTWKCGACATHEAAHVVVCGICGYDKWGNPAYDYAADPRKEYPLHITWAWDETNAEAIKADSEQEALAAAYANWPAATRITLIGPAAPMAESAR